MQPQIRTAPRETSILAGLDECVTARDMADGKRDEQARATAENSSRNGPASDQLHPFVYIAAVGLVFLFAVSAWASFDDGEYTSFLLAVMSGFFFTAVAIPCTLWLTWRRHQDVDAGRDESISWRNWARGELDTWTGPRKAGEAAMEILLPLAAVAFGMLALGMIFHVAAASAVHS